MNWFTKILLLPFAALYSLGIFIRNYAYKTGYLRSTKFDIPVISVGNMNTGGTGKTPHTEYLIRLLKEEFNIGVLSRGYGRKSGGYFEVLPNSTAKQVGDEPLVYKLKYPEIKVAVSEDRVTGIPAMLDQTENVVILLDDAFQHRAVKPGISILLTQYGNLYTDDYILPIGRLREFKSGADRADLIVVSKAPATISEEEKKEIIKKINPKPYQYVFFSHLEYGNIYALYKHWNIENIEKNTVLMLTGIANSTLMQEKLKSTFPTLYTRKFADHHSYDRSDVESIITTYENLPTNDKIIITTEKDAVRLNEFKHLFIEKNIPIYCLPVSVTFAAEDRNNFKKAIYLYLEKTVGLTKENSSNEQNY